MAFLGYDGEILIATVVDSSGFKSGVKSMSNETKNVTKDITTPLKALGSTLRTIGAAFSQMGLPGVGHAFRELGTILIASSKSAKLFSTATSGAAVADDVLTTSEALAAAGAIVLQVALGAVIGVAVALAVALTAGLFVVGASITAYMKLKGSATELKNSFQDLKNAFAITFAPLVEFVTPIIINFINNVIILFNIIALLTAVLLGQKTVWQAVVGGSDKAAKSIGNAGKAARGALADFDKLDVLQKETTSGVDTGGLDTNMFKQIKAPLDLFNNMAFALGKWARGLWDSVNADLNTFAFNLGKWAGDLWRNADKKLNDFAYNLGYFFGTLWSFANGELIIFAFKLGQWAGDLWRGINKNLNDFAYNLGYFFGTLWSFVTGDLIIFSFKLGQWAGGIWRGINAAMNTFAFNMGEWAGTFWSKVKLNLSTFSFNLGVWAGGLWPGIKLNIDLFAFNLGTWAGTLWSKVYTPVSTFSFNMGQWAGNLWSGIKLNLDIFAFNLGTWAGALWKGNVQGPLNTAAFDFGTWAGNLWSGIKFNLDILAFNFGNWAGSLWRSTLGPQFDTLKSDISTYVTDPIAGLFNNMAYNVGVTFRKMLSDAVDIINQIIAKLDTIPGVNIPKVTDPTLPPPPGGCFVAGTLVTLADGTAKVIEDIQVGDMVLSMNVNTHQFVSAEVCEVFHHKPEDTVGYVWINDALGVTPEHMVFVNCSWKPVQLIQLGDFFLHVDGCSIVMVNKLEWIPTNVPVYNLHTAEDNHNYFANGVLVHNSKVQGMGLASGAIIPPNAPFAAILGDQRSGTNLETPESLLRDIIRQEIGNQGGGSPIVIKFEEGNLAGLMRLLKPYSDREDVRIGTNLITGGITR